MLHADDMEEYCSSASSNGHQLDSCIKLCFHCDRTYVGYDANGARFAGFSLGFDDKNFVINEDERRVVLV